MFEREESAIVVLSGGDADARFTARIEGSAVDVTITSVETHASVRIPLAALEGFVAFMGAVHADPAAAVPESEPTPEEESPTAPDSEPTPEEAVHG